MHTNPFTHVFLFQRPCTLTISWMFFLCTLPSAIDSWTNRRAWSLYERHADALPLFEADDYAMMCLTYLWFVRHGTSMDGGLKSIIWTGWHSVNDRSNFSRLFPLETRFLKGDSMMLCWWFCTWDLECLKSTAPGRDWLKKKRRPNWWLEPPLVVAKVGPPGFVHHFRHSAIVGGCTVPFPPHFHPGCLLGESALPQWFAHWPELSHLEHPSTCQICHWISILQ